MRLAKVVSETNRLLGVRRIPLLGFHTKPDDPRGLPHDPADATDISKGWLSGARQTADGWLEYDLEVTDPKAAEAMQNGSLKFTSPQISGTPDRPFGDGIGGRYEDVITHVALTPQPRNPDQGVFQFAGHSQFSLEDAVDDEDNTPDEDTTDAPPAADPPPVNPDIAKPPQDPEVQAVIANLATLGAMLADDWSPEQPGAMGQLNAVLKTLATAKQQSDADRDADSLNDDTEEVAQPVQFSLELINGADAATKKIMLRANAMLKKAADDAAQFALEQAVHKQAAELTAIDRCKMSKGLKDYFKSLVPSDAVQFANDSRPTASIAEMAIAVAGKLPAQFSAVDDAEEVPPPDEADDGRETPEKAEATARRIHSNNKRAS